jgi:glycosyltransferase involved in cell wall biosynthesis
MNTYTLVTPARNEAAYIPRVIESVLGQSVLPVKWVIVSDGSTDETDEIVARAAQSSSLIQLIRISDGSKRSFGSKARAFKIGYDALHDVEFDYIGNLDADVTLEPNYYQRILEEMSKNTLLGVASGVVWDKTANGFRRTISSLNHAVGGVQFWRRACFEDIGGYRPATVGGIDSIAELTARMKGWETKSFPDLAIYHHKPVDSASGRSGIQIAYRAGLTEYHIGTYPPFAILKSIRRWKESPILLSSLVRIFAYGKLWFAGMPRDAPEELVSYLKKEQKAVMRQTLIDIWKRSH